MSLPVPNAQEVQEFRRLYRETRGEEVSDAEALDLATRFLHFYYFATTPPPERSEGTELPQAIRSRQPHDRKR